MKKVIIFALLGFSCSQQKEETSNKEDFQAKDTIYASSFKHDPNYESVVIQISDTSEHGKLDFSIDKKTLFTIVVHRFEEYPIYIRNEQNATVILKDSLNGVFGLIPNDTTFSFEVWQDYGSNNVINKQYKTDSGFHSAILNGLNKVARVDFETKEK
jgi:hypothetical protein